MLDQIYKFMSRLPRFAFLPIVYALGYAGLRGELLNILSWFMTVPASVTQTLTVGYGTACVAHYAILLLTAGYEKLTGKPFWFGLGRTRVALIVAMAIGSVVSLGLIWGTRVNIAISSRGLSDKADEAIGKMEKHILWGITTISQRAQGRLDVIDQAIRNVKGGPAEYEKALTSLGGGRTQGEVTPWTGLVLVELSPLNSERVFLSVPKCDKLPQWVLEAAASPASNTDVWIYPTELGCVVVTQRKNPSYGRLVAITLWSEGNFLEATAPLWQSELPESRYGLYLLQDDDQIVYSSEVSEYGERLFGQSMIPVSDGSLREIRDTRGVRYVYEERGKDPRLCRLKMMIELSPERGIDVWSAIFNTVVLIVLLTLVTLFITAESEGVGVAAKLQGGSAQATRGD